MGKNKQYDGYDAFSYLADEEYNKIELPSDIYSGFEPEPISLSDQEKEKLDKVTEGTVISLHDHAFYFPKNVKEDIWPYVREGRVHTAYDALSQTPLDAVFDMQLDGLSGIHSKHGWKWDDIVHDVSMRACDIHHSNYALQCRSVDDIKQAKEEGKIAIIQALESSAMIENELDRIEQLYGMGIRSMGITYNRSNALGTGGGDIFKRDGGLTNTGVKAVERMNKVGMAISTSHASEQTTLDVCEVTDKPIFDTHALAQGAGLEASRGTSDEELEAIADTGGVIGVLSSTHLNSIETYMDHFEYMVDLVGIDHVAFGPDVLYGDHTRLLEVLGEFHGVELPPSTMENEYVKGLENPTEAWNNIPKWLVREGYTEIEMKKVLSENILRVLDEVWK